jgi:hypothetical protein
MNLTLKSWFSFAAGSVRYVALEWWLMRVGFALVMYPGVVRVSAYNEQAVPVGIGQFVDLTWIARPDVTPWLMPWLTVCAVLYAVGWFPLLTSGMLLAYNIALATLANSQGGGGGAHHTTNLVAFVLLAHFLGTCYHYGAVWKSNGWRAVLSAPWAWWRHVIREPRAAWREATTPVEHAAEQLRSVQIYTIQQAIAATYVVAGLTKLIRSGPQWVLDVVNIPLQFEKNRFNRLHDTGIDPVAVLPDLANAWVARHATLASGFFAMGLLLEVAAFLALWNRRWLALWGLGLIGMHEGISLLMSLGFHYNKMILLLFWVNVPWWLAIRFMTRRPA